MQRKTEALEARRKAMQEWLERGWQIERRIQAKERELERMRDRLYSLRSSQPTGMPRGPRGGDWTRAVDALEDETAALYRDITALCAVRAEISAAIARVSVGVYRELLENRYMSYLSWPEIARRMDYNERYIYKLIGPALDAVAAGMGKERAAR